MERGSREQNIKRIISMEDRIGQCQRCMNLFRCMRKPSLGKGDLEPDVLLVFECESSLTCDMDRLIDLRNVVKKAFNTEKVYHTFMVRCQPKACSARQNANCFIEGKLLDKNKVCMLTGKECEGIPIKPTPEEIMNCMPFVMEEIRILQPQYVILFGDRVSSFIGKACGVYEGSSAGQQFNYEGISYAATIVESAFTEGDARNIANQNA